MNAALDQLASDLGLAAPEHKAQRLVFAYACVARVRHLLEVPEVVQCLDGLGAFVEGRADRAALDDWRTRAAHLANHHPGSKSIDGCGHAAVSASYAVAKALEGKALEAASYAAYATVYAQGGSSAVADVESFDTEWVWQRDCLAALAQR